MLHRGFLILLRLRRRYRWLLLVALAVGVSTLAHTTPTPWWIAAAAALPLLVLLGAVEPVLVVLVAAEAGVVWAAPGLEGFLAGLAVAIPAALVPLYRWRHRGVDAIAVAGLVVLAGVAVSSAWLGPWVLGNALTALVLAPFGMDILLPRDRGGAPRLVWLLGGFPVFLWGAFWQISFIWIGLALLRLPPNRVRHWCAAGIRFLFGIFPYGKNELLGVRPEAFSKPAVIVSNHQSSIDIFLVLSLPGDIRMTPSQRVAREPWLGFSIRALGHPPVDFQLVRNCRKIIAEGGCVHMFPEGTRSRDGWPAKFHRGAFQLACELNCDVLPVVLTDTRTAVPRDAYWVERYRLSVKVLPRVAPAGKEPKELQTEVEALMREELKRELRRLNTPANLRRKLRRHYRYQGWRVLSAVWRETAAITVPAEPESDELHIEDCGYGVGAHLLTECYPWLTIHATDPDPRRIAVAKRSAVPKPNLRFDVAGS
ncbi:MAG: lysophospholipid acyltransferase family protein [Planctomycetota bacterium]